MPQQLKQIPDRIDSYFIREGSLQGILFRKVQLFDPIALCGDGHRQGARYRTELSCKGELSDKSRLFRSLFEFPGGRQNTNQQWQIIYCPCFLFISRRKVHRHTTDRELKSIVFDRCANAFPGLLHCGIGQADNIESREPGGDIDLNTDFIASHAADSEAADSGKHIFQASGSQVMAICSSSSCLCSTVEGAPIIISWALLFIGNGMISRILSSPASSITIRSIPGAIPA